MKIDDDIYRELIDGAGDPISSFYRDGTYRYVNRAFAEGVGKKMEDIIGKKIWDIFLREEADRRYAAVKYVFETGEERVFETQAESGESASDFITTVKPLFDEQGNVSVVICISRDITDRKLTEERLRYYATTDELTGFVNRRTGLAILAKIHDFSKRSGKPFTVCYVDINDLKHVNDTYGHSEGDCLISASCEAMRESIRQMDTLCRMGGDEFLILFPECGKGDAEQVWDRIMEKLADYNSSSRKPYSVSMSHGILEYDPHSGDAIETLLSRVDSLMYREKRIYKKNRSVQDMNGHFD